MRRKRKMKNMTCRVRFLTKFPQTQNVMLALKKDTKHVRPLGPQPMKRLVGISTKPISAAQPKNALTKRVIASKEKK